MDPCGSTGVHGQWQCLVTLTGRLVLSSHLVVINDAPLVHNLGQVRQLTQLSQTSSAVICTGVRDLNSGHDN